MSMRLLVPALAFRMLSNTLCCAVGRTVLTLWVADRIDCLHACACLSQRNSTDWTVLYCKLESNEHWTHVPLSPQVSPNRNGRGRLDAGAESSQISPWCRPVAGGSELHNQTRSDQPIMAGYLRPRQPLQVTVSSEVHAAGAGIGPDPRSRIIDVRSVTLTTVF